MFELRRYFRFSRSLSAFEAVFLLGEQLAQLEFLRFVVEKMFNVIAQDALWGTRLKPV